MKGPRNHRVRQTIPRAAPAAEVRAALLDVAGLGGFFAVRLGGPDLGWHPVTESYARGFPDLVAATAARHRSPEPRLGASIAQLGHAARLWSPVLACTVLHGIVPDLSGLQHADEGPALRLPDATGQYAEGVPRLADELYAAVMTGQLDPLRAGLRVKVAPRLLDGNSASALVEAGRAILVARPGARERLTVLIDELLRTRRLAGTGRITGPELTFRRRSCCLYYRAPAGAKCGDCGLLDRTTHGNQHTDG
ncbi:(2Fe-2S)-binding protein [Streptomyces sp. NPDC059076]|uniref:(2Fe-2S)-binding protein n=1 Tax=unclassified Streptomyces TaxID=2593676 RepID=UPI0036B89C67